MTESVQTHRLTLADAYKDAQALAAQLADRRPTGTSSVTLKTNAKGETQREVTIMAGESQENVDLMVEQARTAYRTLQEPS